MNAILDETFGKGSRKSDADPAFAITAKRNVHYPALRHKLRFIQLYQQYGTVEEAARQYMSWAHAWNSNFKPRSSRRTAIPKTISRFAKALEAHEAERAKRPRAKKSEEYHYARSDIVRFLRSADKIVRNVASGVFPGSG